MDEYFAISAVDMDGLAAALNKLVENGGSITSISVAVDKVAYALILGTKPSEEEQEEQN